MFLDYAEDQARRRKQVFLRDWRIKLDGFLRFNERNVLPDAGTVSREEADRKAEEQYRHFERRRRTQLEAKGEADMLGATGDLETRAAELAKTKAKQKKK